MKTLKILTFAIFALSLAVPAFANPAADVVPVDEAVVHEAAIEGTPELAIDFTPAPAPMAYCATFHANSWSECESGCYARSCGLDHWNPSTCECFCGYQF